MKYIEKADLWFPDAEQHFLREKNGKPFWQGYQQDRIDAALQYVRRFGTAIDVGAHIGLMSRYLATKFTRVDAFEPDPEAFACWQKNLEAFPNATGNQIAVGATTGRVGLETTEVGENTGNRQIIPDGKGVSMISLDHWAGQCDFIKIDVQGYERDVLKGAAAFLARHRPVLVVEIEAPGKLRRSFGSPAGTLKLLAKLGAVQRARIGDDYIFTFDD